ncbi:MAG: hypothetical protein AB1489_28440, partial [Acidobacteriota bacterium]
ELKLGEELRLTCNILERFDKRLETIENRSSSPHLEVKPTTISIDRQNVTTQPKTQIFFPSLATECHDCLFRAKIPANYAKASYLEKQVLVKVSTDDGAEFIVIAVDGLDYAIPKSHRLTQAQDFYTYYQHLYNCDNPGSGEMYIDKPAIVRRVPNGWQLQKKGILTIA